MAAVGPRKLIVPMLSLALAASLAANAFLYRETQRPLFAPGDEPLIERTVAAAVAQGTSPAEVREKMFPMVMHLGDRTCVELRSRRALGHHGACYDRRTGKLLEETASVVDRARRPAEILEDSVTGLDR